jgi:hypothetical protein
MEVGKRGKRMEFLPPFLPSFLGFVLLCFVYPNFGNLASDESLL